MLSAPIAFSDSPTAEAGKHTRFTWQHKVIDGYMLWLPEGYDRSKKWPVIFSLHSSGEVGGDINSALLHGPAQMIENNTKKELQFVRQSFIILSPHLSQGDYHSRQWFHYIKTLEQMLDQVLQDYNGDPNRLYLTGYSTGSTGTWGYLSQRPKRFAAAMPICGYTYPAHGTNIYIKNYHDFKSVPLWIFQNAWDKVVPYSHARKAQKSLERAGGSNFLKLQHHQKGREPLTYLDIKQTSEQTNGKRRIFSTYFVNGHDNGDIYQNAIIYRWFLSFNK